MGHGDDVQLRHLPLATPYTIFRRPASLSVSFGNWRRDANLREKSPTLISQPLEQLDNVQLRLRLAIITCLGETLPSIEIVTSGSVSSEPCSWSAPIAPGIDVGGQPVLYNVGSVFSHKYVCDALLRVARRNPLISLQFARGIP